jgi:5-hydroxyisourate hydrolase
MSTSPITTHVLDTARGKPAAGVPVTVELRGRHDEWHRVGAGVTDADGRQRSLLVAGTTFQRGVYRISFDTAAYFAASATSAFYPAVAVEFTVTDPAQHYHVPLLLSPFGYSTYRGS